MKTLYARTFISLFLIAAFTLLTSNTFANNRYWVSNGSNTSWSNTANWSNTSGGVGGLSVPGSNDVVFFDANGNYNCVIDANVNISGIKTLVGYTGTLVPNGYNIYVQGDAIDWRSGTMAIGSGSFTFDTPGEFTLVGGTFNAPSGGFTCNKIFKVQGGIFNGYSTELYFTNNFHVTTGTFNSTTGNIHISGSGVYFDEPNYFIHNNGKMIFDGTQTTNIQIGQGPNRRLVIYDMELNKTNTNVDNLNITDDDTIRVMHNFMGTDGQIKGLNSALEINGDFTTGPAFNSSNTSINFIGSADQTVTMGTGTTSTLDGAFALVKPNTSKVILNSPLQLDLGGPQKLVLTKGILQTTSTNLLTLGNNVIVVGGSNNSYVDGPMQKDGKDGFTFPVGKSGFYAPIAISGNANMGTILSSTTSYQAEWFKQDTNSVPYNVNSREATIGSVSRCEYWILNRVSGTANAYVWLSFDASLSCYINSNPARKLVAHWDGTKWEDKGNGDYSVSPFIRSLAMVSSFSPFTIGSIDPSEIPLPLYFSNFKAQLNNGKVQMDWTLYGDVINTDDKMYVQHSIDGTNWSDLTQVTFVLNKYNYQVNDNSPAKGTSYYRIKLIEATGKISYSPTRSVKFDESVTSVMLSPNPATTDIKISLSKAFSAANLQIFDMTGRVVYQENISNKQTVSVVTSSYARGVYVMNIEAEGERFQQRFVVEK